MKTFGQNPIKYYTPQWKKVHDFTSQGLPVSAIEEVKKIYQLAKADKQDAQIIKSVTYLATLQEETRDDNDVFSVKEFEQELETASEPSKSIISSLLAGKYYNYYLNQRWKLYQRTQTTGYNKTDIATWSLEDFHKKITRLYLQSIGNEKLLQQTKIEPFDAIIISGNTPKLRPTLYDLLAFRALEYFSSDERNIKKPATAFEINSASAFDPASDFIHRKFITKDSASLEYRALLIYQKLISFHLEDKQPYALIDADIHRLQFVQSKSVHPDKDELYYMSIHHLADQYATTPAAAQAWYLTAAWHKQTGSAYNPHQDTTARYEKRKAVEICEKIIRENPDTEGGINAYNLLNAIKQPFIDFATETVNVPDQPFLVSVGYGNVEKLFLRLVKLNNIKNAVPENIHDSQYRTKLLSQEATRSWEQDLPQTNDFQHHRVEIKVDALPVGDYVLIASTNKNFRDSKAITGVRLFHVSNISYVNANDDFFVLDRTSGKPLAEAKVLLWENQYDYKSQKYFNNKSDEYVTDKNGYFRRKSNDQSEKNQSVRPEIIFGNDRLFQTEILYQTIYNQQPATSESRTFTFTDRSIYRPGQTVYYKAIIVQEKEIFKDTKRRFSVALHNVNGEKVAEDIRNVNDYGTFSGKFQIPQGTLNGNFFIQIENRDPIYFSVEEYKRPRFFVEYDTLKTTYKANESIRITGSTLAYAGNPVDNASVKYRVVRTSRFVYPWRSSMRWMPMALPMEIVHGETMTDQNGQFTVDFTAIPDLKIDKKLNPVFDYVVYADITDANGETRSGEKLVSVSYKTVILKLSIPEILHADSLKSLDIRAENTNGFFQSSEVTLKINSLQPPKQLIRKRYWQRPDQFVISETEFTSHFPHDEYDDESNEANWKSGPVLIEKTGLLEDGKPFRCEGAERLKPGKYQLEITTKDKNGEEVKLTKILEVTDPESKELSSPEYLWAQASAAVEPGQTAYMKIGSSSPDVFLIRGIYKNKDSRIGEFSFFELNDNKETFEYPIKESDRGGYIVNYLFVKDNRFYQHNESIQVPWTNKALTVSYQTFRNKVLPGSAETWKVTISGYKKDKVAAEMLASMYDQSLDQFKTHHWQSPGYSVWPVRYALVHFNGNANFGQGNANIIHTMQFPYKNFDKSYDRFIAPVGSRGISIRGMASGGAARQQLTGSVEKAMEIQMDSPVSQDVFVGYGQRKKSPEEIAAANEEASRAETQIRKNFNETAFFFPDLKTDKNGAVTFSFTMPEALTRWKFQAMAHTKDLAFGYSSKEIITQKDLMVQPNAPRFLREGDQMNFSTKIVNLTEKELEGTATFQLFDSETNEPVDELFENNIKNLPFKLAARQSTAIHFPIRVPKHFAKTIVWRVVAKAGNMSDGEENILPVIPNRMLVTESIPLNMRGSGTKNFKFEKLIKAGTSGSLTTQALTVEYTSNPAWYAIQALPYLMEYPYDCAEQIWNRYYANALATHVAGSSPRIAKVFENWKTADTTALESNLAKNQELKSVLLEETPWVLAAKTESEQKRNIALLFDLVRTGTELSVNLEKIKQMQSANGGFVWFKGGPDDRYMTQYIVSGIGHLHQLKALSKEQGAALKNITDQAIPYLDNKIKQDYEQLLKQKADLKEYVPGALEIQYLYMRSFFPENKTAEGAQKAYNFFMDRAQKSWLSQTNYLQGMIALASHRANDVTTSKAILKSLKETAIRSEELGMYWKSGQSWWWYENPAERQALLIEAFQEAGNDTQTVDELRTWLLKNKQTNRWESTKATAEACYALLLQGTEWLSASPDVTIKLGSYTLKPDTETQQQGTGYFQKSISAELIKPGMGEIQVDVQSGGKVNTGTSWGAVYWQYFEDLDKISFAETPLKIEKKLFIEKNSDTGPTLVPVKPGDAVAVGDKIKVRIELRVDRDMEYVHMKDMRASGLEPVNVLSGYKWQGGLGYYESTKDVSTNFFFSRLNKGTYVFDYPLFVTHQGDFSNGITSVQCMYAPEFTAHSEGVRLLVK